MYLEFPILESAFSGNSTFLMVGILGNVLVWQILSFILGAIVFYRIIIWKRYRNKIREFVERRTQVILFQKQKIEGQKKSIYLGCIAN